MLKAIKNFFGRHNKEADTMPAKTKAAKSQKTAGKPVAKPAAKAPVAKKPAAKPAPAKKPAAKPAAKAPAKPSPAKKPVAKPAVAAKAAPAKTPVAAGKKPVVAKAAPVTKPAAAKPASTTQKTSSSKPVTSSKPASSSSKKTSGKAVQTASNFIPYQEKTGEEYMNDAQKAHFRRLLLDWKAELMQEVDRTVNHMKDEAANFPDPADRATQEEEFSLELRARDRERKLIKKIDSTLELIEQDDYGYCEACGIEIGVRRLEARPTATLCIDCKTLAEIKEKQIGG